MSDVYEEYGLELEADELLPEDYGNPDKPTKHGKIGGKGGGGWLKAVIALVLGTVIGIGSVIGGFALALNRPARPTIEFIGSFTGLNYEETVKDKILSEEYENKTILEIVEALGAVVSEKNLASIDRISPSVGDYLDEVLTNMATEFGVKLNTETVLNTEFADLPAYIGEEFRVTPLGDILKAIGKQDTLEPLLMELCYGEESHYTVENNIVQMKEGYKATTVGDFSTSPKSILNNMVFASVLTPKADDSLMLSMAYGREDVTYTFERNEDDTVKLNEQGYPIVKMLPLFFEKKEDAYLNYNGDSFDYTLENATDGFVKMTVAPTFEGETEAVYFLKEGNDGIYYAYTEPVDDETKIATFKKTKIGDLSDTNAILDSLYLKDALNVKYDPNHPQNDPHAILFSLAYGIEGVDYRVDPVTKEITMIGDAQPRSIGDLRNSGTDLINDVAIADIMEAELDDALSMYLLYGKKGVHYDFDEHGDLVMLQKYIAISEDMTKVYNEYGEELDKKTYTTPGYDLNVETSTYIDENGNTYLYREAIGVDPIDTDDGGQAKKYYLFIDEEKNIAISEEEGGVKKVYTTKGELLTEKVPGYVLTKSTYTDENGVLYHYQPIAPETTVSTADGQVKLYYLFNKKSKMIAISDDGTKVYNEFGDLLPVKTGAEEGYVLDTANATYTDLDGTVYGYQAANPVKTLDTHDGEEVKVYYLVTSESPKIAISDDHTKVYNASGELLTPQVDGYVLNGDTYTDSHGKIYHCQEATPSATINVDGKDIKVYRIYEYAMFTRHSLGELSGGDHLISNMNDRLTLAEVLGEKNIGDNKFLKHVKDSTISALPTAIKDLTVGQVFEDDIYITCQINDTGAPIESSALGVDGEPIMIEVGEWYYIDKERIYPSDSEKAVRGTWKYLLMEGGEIDTTYKVTSQMNEMINNMTDNIKNSSLYDLHNNSIMTFDKNTLKTPIKTKYMNGAINIEDKLKEKEIDPEKYPTLGSMTTDKIVAFMGVLLDALNNASASTPPITP